MGSTSDSPSTTQTGAHLLAKLLLINSIITVAAVIGGATATRRALSADPTASAWSIVLAISAGALGFSAIANSVIALPVIMPIRRLTAVIKRRQAGDPQARADLNKVTDPDLQALASSFNAMLDGMTTPPSGGTRP